MLVYQRVIQSLKIPSLSAGKSSSSTGPWLHPWASMANFPSPGASPAARGQRGHVRLRSATSASAGAGSSGSGRDLDLTRAWCSKSSGAMGKTPGKYDL